MRALTRIRTFAAALALLLFLTSTALANVPQKPIDRPEGPPEPNPTEVGDPDFGSGGSLTYARQLLLAAVITNPSLRQFTHLFMKRNPSTSAQLRQQLRGGNPR